MKEVYVISAWRADGDGRRKVQIAIPVDTLIGLGGTEIAEGTLVDQPDHWPAD